MKCLNCGGMQMLRCEHTGGGIYWLCPRCNSTTESTGGGRMTDKLSLSDIHEYAHKLFKEK